MTLRILQVLAGATDGGAETAYVDFCLALKEAGVDVIAATRKHSDRVPVLQAANIPVYTYPFGGKIDIFTPAALRRLIAREKPQIVQTWMSRAAERLPVWQGTPEEKPYQVLSRLGGYYKLKHFKNADWFSTITPDLKAYLEKNGVAPERIRHINNFAETETATTMVRKSDLDTPPDAPVLLTLSRLHKSKALDVLIKAMPALPGVYLWLAGEGPLRGDLDTLARREQVADRVRFLGWRSDRAALLKAADICVFPSRYEPFGTTFVQAWAQRTPLVCSDADGPRQYVRPGQDALMVPREDVTALAAAIRTVLTDRILAAKLGESGYLRYRNEFTKQHTMDAFLSYYQDILRSREISTPVRMSAPA